ncbi:DUF6308 family protein [Pengzhenrongella phosphoraccumulans]|uniref:DUF6308 family protein n=1 Tax=Pengzhenrongella phosphoraccumulans TaxID=3114394 RepID=UPI00389043A6
MSESKAPWDSKPDDWKDVPAGVFEHAKRQTMAALNTGGPRPVGPRLAYYYDRDRNYAGASFASMYPNDPNDLTATDLHAVSLLSVTVGPRATRRLLNDGPERNEILKALRHVPVTDLQVAGPEALAAMGALQESIKSHLSAPDTKFPNRWVTAAKICARKRPSLFPVRDRVVCEYLGLLRRGSWQIDYQVFRSLIGDAEVVHACDAAVSAAHDAASDRRLVLDTEMLRVLDAALWTYPDKE